MRLFNVTVCSNNPLSGVRLYNLEITRVTLRLKLLNVLFIQNASSTAASFSLYLMLTCK